MSLKNNGNSRRDFLIKTISLVPAVAMGSASLGTVAVPVVNAAGKNPVVAPQKARDYQPSFFTAEEFAFIKAAVARLIPADEKGPGALEAGVPEFIDRQMQTPYGTGSNWYMQGPFHPEADPLFGYQMPLPPKDIYKLGLADAMAWVKNVYHKPFTGLTAARQDELLGQMESGQPDFKQVPSNIFFAALLQNTREGFFSDPIHGGNQGMAGWKLIGFPGARADFMDWVERNEKYPFAPVSIRGERS